MKYKKELVFALTALASSFLMATASQQPASAVNIMPFESKLPYSVELISNNVDVDVTITFEARNLLPTSDSNAKSASPDRIESQVTFTHARGENTVTASGEINLGNINYTQIGNYWYDFKPIKAVFNPESDYPSGGYVSIANEGPNTFLSMKPLQFVVSVRSKDIYNPGKELVAKPIIKDGPELKFKQNPALGEDKGATRTYLNISNAVAGDLGDTSKCFTYELDFTNAQDGIYNLDFSDNKCSHPSTSFDTTKSKKLSFSLSHGERLVVGRTAVGNQLYYKTPFTIKQTGSYPNYQSSLGGLANTTSREGLADAPGGAEFGTNNEIAFKNTNTSTVKTGINIKNASYATVLGAGIVGSAFIIKQRKRR